MILSLRRAAALALAAAIALALPTSPTAAQQPGARATPAGILIDFQDTDLRGVITALAEAASLNVTFGELPPRRITLRVRQPVAIDSIPALLRAIAEANGLRVSEGAGLLRFEGAPTVAALQPGAQPQLFVYRLRHARAARLAGTLQAIFGGGGVDVAGETAPLSQRLREQQISPLRLDTLFRGRADVYPVVPTLSGRLQSQVQIVPDENTNSLLVRATPGDWTIIQQAIQAVDIRPLQVLIEVLIAEVRRSRDLDVGVSVKSREKTDAGQERASAEIVGSTADLGTGELLLKWANGGNIDVSVAVRALASRGDVRILSRPVLLAQNNQEARILVGTQRPFVQVFRSLPTESGVRDQIVQYRDVGTSLTIIPTINPDGYVNLQLTQEVSNATNETQFGAPVISTREAQTQLFVRDGQTTVIGGLIDRQTERTRTGVPVLVGIPVLGALFGRTTSSTARSELFLFLTPHVVRSDQELEQLRDSLDRKLELLPKELRLAPPFRSKPVSPDSVREPPR